MRKICIVSVILVALLALAACKEPIAPDGGGSSGGNPVDQGNTGGGGTPVVTPPPISFSGVNKYVATSNVNSGQIKGSFKTGGLYYYYIYLGQLENIPLFYGMKYYHSPELGDTTYTYTKATTDTVSSTVTESSSQTVSVSEKHTKSSTSETTLKAEASVKYQGFGVTAEAKASAEQKWKTYTEDTSGFQKDTSFANTIEKGTSKAETTQQSWSIALTEKHRVGYYRFTFFSVSDVYLWVIRDPAQPGALELEFKEYINPAEFIWKMDYSDPTNPEFNKTDDTKFQLALSVLDNLPPPEVDLDYVEEFSLDRTEIGVLKGSTFQLSPRIKPDYATEKGVIWTSSNTSVATVSNTGIVTGVSDGKATITAKSKDPAYKGAPATCIVSVSNVPIAVTGVNLNMTSTTLFVGGEEKLNLTIIPSNATNSNVTWRTNPSSSSVATVSSNGVVTAQAVGTVEIIVKTTDGGFEKTCTVTVRPVPVAKITLTTNGRRLDAPVDLGNPTTVTITCEVTPDNAANKNVIWTSSDDRVATVIDGVVTAKAAGKTTITATPADNSNLAEKIDLTVRGAWKVTKASEWYDALDGIKYNGNGSSASDRKDYVIEIKGDKDKTNSIEVTGDDSGAPSFGIVTNITVTLQGYGWIRQQTKGKRLLSIRSSQMVYINGGGESPLYLYGLSTGGVNNSTALINISGSDASLVLKDGYITGNHNATTGYGGGVDVERGGSFTMQGGFISNNNSSSTYREGNGGGIYIEAGGTFSMEEGTIELNTASNYGGGVFVEQGGSFKKSGGFIYGPDTSPHKNVAKSSETYGAAVFAYIGSTGYYRDRTLSRNDSLSTSSTTISNSGWGGKR